jgi:hypothetical protein
LPKTTESQGGLDHDEGDNSAGERSGDPTKMTTEPEKDLAT